MLRHLRPFKEYQLILNKPQLFPSIPLRSSLYSGRCGQLIFIIALCLLFSSTLLTLKVQAAPPDTIGNSFMIGGSITTTLTTSTTAQTAPICPNFMAEPTDSELTALAGAVFRLAADVSGRLLPEPMLTKRVNILLMGSDTRNGDQTGHTDSMILATVDPISKTAAMLSIPRDLWVTIPGYKENRINTAYRAGQLLEHPGGGPALVMETVEANLGVPVDYYAVINFEGFAQVIDVMGGIDLCVPESIDAAAYYGYPAQYIDKENYFSFVPVSAVEPLPVDPNNPDQEMNLDPNRGYEFLYIEAGEHHLDGQTALTYARSRASVTADFARVQRQQAVLMAMRYQTLRVGMLPKIPELWQTMSAMYDTNLQLADLLPLAQLAYTIPSENIRLAAISHEQTLGYRAHSGASVLLPHRAEIKLLVDSLFGSSQPTAPLTQLEIEAGLVPAPLVASESDNLEAMAQ